MKIASICPTCATYTNAVCVIYDGPYLSNLDIDPLTNLDEIIGIINEKIGTLQPALGFVPERLSNKSTSVLLGTSNTLYPTQNAVKTFVETAISAIPIPNLQQVTTAGNRTMDDIVIEDNPLTPDEVTVLTKDNILISKNSLAKSVGLEIDTLAFYENGFLNGTLLKPPATSTAINNLLLPDASGNLAISVNGIGADVNGEITIPDPYRVYVAVISMVDGSIVNLIKNTLGTTLTWTASSGAISTSSSFLASESNTFVSVTSGSTVPKIVSTNVAVSSLNWGVTIYQTDNAGVPNNTDSVYVEIRVY